MSRSITSLLFSFVLILTSSPSLYAQNDVNFQTRDVDAIVNENELDNAAAAIRRTTDNQTTLSASTHSQQLVGQYAEQVALTYALVEHLDNDCQADPVYKEFVPSVDMLGNNASFQFTLYEATKLKKDIAQASAINAELGGCKNYQIDDVRRTLALIDAQLATVDDHLFNFETSREIYLAAAEQTRAEDEARTRAINDAKAGQGSGIFLVIIGIAMVALGKATLNFGLVAAGIALIAVGVLTQISKEKDLDKAKRYYTMECNDYCYRNEIDYKYQDTPNSCSGEVETTLAVPTLSGRGLIIPSEPDPISEDESGTTDAPADSSGSGGSVDDSPAILEVPRGTPESVFMNIFIHSNAYAQEVGEDGIRKSQLEQGEIAHASVEEATGDIKNPISTSLIETIAPILRERTNILLTTPRSRYEYLLFIADEMQAAIDRANAVRADLLARREALVALEREMLAQQGVGFGADGGESNNCSQPFDSLNQSFVNLGGDTTGVGCIVEQEGRIVGDPTCACRQSNTCATVSDTKIEAQTFDFLDNNTNSLLAENRQIVRSLTNSAFSGNNTRSSLDSAGLVGKLRENTSAIRRSLDTAINKRKEEELKQIEKLDQSQLNSLGLTDKEVDNAKANLKQLTSANATGNNANSLQKGQLPDQNKSSGKDGNKVSQEITKVGDLERGSGSSRFGSDLKDEGFSDDSLNEDPYVFKASADDLSKGASFSEQELASLDREVKDKKYDSRRGDGLFTKITKAYIRKAYPVLLLKRKTGRKHYEIYDEDNPSQ